MPSATSAVFANGDSAQAFPKGGRTRRLELPVGVWREFDPQRVDLYRVHVPAVAAGRIVSTSSTDHSDIVDGSAVSAEHLMIAPPYYGGTWHDCYDTSTSAPVRFFFALVDAPAGASAAILTEAAAP